MKSEAQNAINQVHAALRRASKSDPRISVSVSKGQYNVCLVDFDEAGRSTVTYLQKGIGLQEALDYLAAQ